MLHLRLSIKENRCYVSCAKAIEKENPATKCVILIKFYTKLDNNPEMLRSFQRELGNSKNLFLLTTFIFLKDIQLSITECLQNDLSLNLKDVGHPSSSPNAGGENLYSFYGFIIITVTLCNSILS